VRTLGDPAQMARALRGRIEALGLLVVVRVGLGAPPTLRSQTMTGSWSRENLQFPATLPISSAIADTSATTSA